MPEDGLVVDVDLYDSEVLAIEKVIGALNRSRSTRTHTVDGWRNEIENRFHEAGFKVSVVLQQMEEVQEEGKATQKDDRIFTTITITGRVEEMHVGQYDHERQREEVRRDILGRGAVAEVKKMQFAVSGPDRARRTKSGIILPPKR